jgi:hypothetical protein
MNPRTVPFMKRMLPLLCLLWVSAPVVAFDEPHRPDDAAAQESREEKSGPWKLTAGHYALRGAPDGTDLNLRWRQGDLSGWVGAWVEPGAGAETARGTVRQGRVGFERAFRPFESVSFLSDLGVSVQPSLQLASAGFVGGSLTLEAGEPWFSSVGIGRTNGKPYVNLNFDPNDAISVATGHRDPDGTTYYLLLVADDRLGTGQRHLHLVGRWPIQGGGRLTLDLLAKRGIGEDFQGAPQFIRSGGISLGYDAPRWFARLARDQRQNFGPSDAWRLSFGSRF